MTPRATAFRAFNSGGARGTVNGMASWHLMQEMAGGFFKNENRSNVEHFEPHGFTSAIVPKTDGGAAEAVMNFMTGSRTHAIASVIGDRRFRPRGLQSGENAQYDDIGQMTYLAREALYLLSHDGADYAGKTAQRFASLRHVNKSQQPQPQQLGSNATPSQVSEAQQQQENYKHEGDSVNTEVRTSKNRIEFRVGDNVVGYYDASQQKWHFQGAVIDHQAVDGSGNVLSQHSIVSDGILAKAKNIYGLASNVMSQQAGTLYKTPPTSGQSVSFGELDGLFAGLL